MHSIIQRCFGLHKRGVWERKSPSGVQGQSPGRGSGRRSLSVLEFWWPICDNYTCNTSFGHYACAVPRDLFVGINTAHIV